MKKHSVWVVVLLLCSCIDDDVDSTGVTTNNIDAEYQVRATSSSTTHVDARFFRDDDELELTGDDTIEVSFANAKVRLTEQDDGNNVYRATIATPADGDRIYFSFYRDAGDNPFFPPLFDNSFEDARSSTVTLPPSFMITAPDDDALFNGGLTQQVTLAWEPFGFSDTMRLHFETTCIGKVSQQGEVVLRGDEGTFSLQFVDLDVSEGASCTVQLTLLRRRYGELDRELNNGFIFAQQERTIQIRIEPS